MPAIPVALLAVVLGERLDHFGPLVDIVGIAALAYAGGSFWIGLPYLAIAALAIGWSHEASIKQLRVALNSAPLLFTAFLVGNWARLAGALAGPTDWRLFVERAGPWALYVLLYGYVCVGIAHAALAVLRRRGYLEPAAYSLLAADRRVPGRWPGRDAREFGRR